MKILTDYHHGNLYYAMHLLFEKRLRLQMYRPIGYEWYYNGFFKVAEPYGNAQDTIKQYLGVEGGKWDPYKNLNGEYVLEDGVYYIKDPENVLQHKAITFDIFKKMKFDYIVATFPLHTNWELLKQYQPQAKFIMQLGNEGQTTNMPNVLSSIIGFEPKENQKVYFYHQEFEFDDYYYTEPPNHNTITSFVVLLPEREKFLRLKDALSEFDCRAYGPGAVDGTIGDVKHISEKMRNTAFGYHNKPQGEGFGHVIHKWYACGRPCIVNYEVYKSKLAGKLLIPDKTCISLDQPFDELVRKVRYFSQPENHKKMCEDAYARFKEVVDFDKEAKEIEQWLKNEIV